MDPTRSRPSIWQTGTIHDKGDHTLISGWGIGLCATRCDCHWNAAGPQLAETDAGTLGLATTQPDCQCCQPWQAAELLAILHDMADLDTIQAQPKTTS